MKGVVDKVWKNKTDDGKLYFVLKIGGEKYSVWDKKYMDGIEEGSMVEYESTQSGKVYKRPALMDVARLYSQGQSIREIARQLETSKYWVEYSINKLKEGVKLEI